MTIRKKKINVPQSQDLLGNMENDDEPLCILLPQIIINSNIQYSFGLEMLKQSISFNVIFLFFSLPQMEIGVVKHQSSKLFIMMVIWSASKCTLIFQINLLIENKHTQKIEQG